MALQPMKLANCMLTVRFHLSMVLSNFAICTSTIPPTLLRIMSHYVYLHINFEFTEFNFTERKYDTFLDLKITQTWMALVSRDNFIWRTKALDTSTFKEELKMSDLYHSKCILLGTFMDSNSLRIVS